MIDEIRAAGAMVRLFSDGDVNFALATCKEDSGVDLFMSTGGAPEGVLAAVAMRCLGGDFQERMAWRNDEEIERARVMGFSEEDLTRIWSCEEIASGDVMFCATGVTGGPMLPGVDFFGGGDVAQLGFAQQNRHDPSHRDDPRFYPSPHGVVMAVANRSVIINVTPEQFYSVVADFEAYPEFCNDVEAIEVLSRDGDSARVLFTIRGEVDSVHVESVGRPPLS